MKIITSTSLYINFTGETTAVVFAVLGIAWGCDEERVELVADEAAGSYVPGVYVDYGEEAAVFGAALFDAAAAPEGYPEVVFGVDAHAIGETFVFFGLEEDLAVWDFACF